MINTIKERFDRDRIVRVMALGQLASPKLVELAGRFADVHGVWLDQEHSAISHAELELLLTACRAAGLDAISRVAPTAGYTGFMRPMEAGCSGVMAAQIRTMDEVQQIASWSKYPPRGTRGLFLGCYESGFGGVSAEKHIQQANEDRWLAIQIETAESVELVDDIARTDGVDWLFVGPSDLSCTLGVPGQFDHPDFLRAIERVAQAARQVGKPWGTLARDVGFARSCREMGCQLFSVVGDVDAVKFGLAVANERMTELFGVDDNA